MYSRNLSLEGYKLESAFPEMPAEEILRSVFAIAPGKDEGIDAAKSIEYLDQVA